MNICLNGPDNETAIIKIFNSWRQENHPIELSTAHMLKQQVDYLHKNPVRAGIVNEAQDYVYSSAVDYYTTRKGLIEIQHLQC